MRIVKEVPHLHCKITVFSWNNRYILKFEQGYLEQTYKIDEFDLESEHALDKILTGTFIDLVLENFQTMSRGLKAALQTV